MKFLSIEQLRSSLERLSPVHPFFGTAFLALKRAAIPVGRTEEIVFSNVVDEILYNHYRVTKEFPGFFHPFKSANRWVKPRYGSTAMQRITVDTFGSAFLHEKGTSRWGWKPDYMDQLASFLRGGLIPAFDLAVWLFRQDQWEPTTTRRQVRDRFFRTFNITKEEQAALFDTRLPADPKDWLSSKPISQGALLTLIGRPPGSRPEEGALLRYLEARHVGPAGRLRYEPDERLNIVTGDNSLGKTFLLDLIWWALTDNWCGFPALPDPEVANKSPSIAFEVTVGPRRTQPIRAEFDWSAQEWKLKPKRDAVAGLVIYSRFNTSFAVWDPARAKVADQNESTGVSGQVLFNASQVWDGVPATGARGADRWICNGLLLDWVRWQTGGDEYKERFEALVACLSTLSPSPGEPLTPGKPQRRFALGARETPTLRMPYGEIPIRLASAGVQRIIALGYILVWSWFEHLAITADTRSEPQRRLVLIVDEAEAHLHPRWQRVIIPALLRVIKVLSEKLSPQIHVATHSPLVMASAETCFDEDVDAVHHLRLEGNDVRLEQLPFVKRGRVDRWLMSEVFGLEHARSLPAAEVIEEAKKLQLSPTAQPAEVARVHSRLVEVLAPDDEFWPRWRFFADQHRVDQ